MSAELYEVTDDGAVLLHVHAQPGAGRTAVAGRHGDALKVKVAAPPEGGRANAALAETLAEAFGVKVAQVTLVSGQTSRVKRFRIEGVDMEHLDRIVERLLADAGPARTRRVPPRP